MKKSKFLKRAGVVALSSLLAAGSLAALAGCGNNSARTLSVYIFCNESDKQVNESIMKEWAKDYSAEHPELGFEIQIDFTPSTDKPDYYSKLKDHASGGAEGIEDVIYLSPRYVKSYSRLGYVMDLTDYLTEADRKATNSVWNNALSYYGYDKTDSYTLGQPIRYNESAHQFETTADGKKVGVYALPKDYSNFSLGFNKQFFSAELVQAYQTAKATAERGEVKNPAASNSAFKDGATAVANYTKTSSPIARFAGTASNTYTYSIYDENGKPTGETKTVHGGEEAPMIAIGVPVTYTPFNYYLFNDYDSALAAGDPIANLVFGLTAGEGFTVTLPGLPGWTFNVNEATGYDASANYDKAVDKNASYDGTIGHTVFTYQEYGALTWAMTYYLNTFAWDKDNEGYGGRAVREDNKLLHYSIYGGEQYEGQPQGNVLYLLPWLAANEADFVNVAATTALNATGVKTLNEMRDATHADAKVYSYAGTSAEKRDKKNLDGTTRKDDVQYGMNSQHFLETYMAYANHGAVWNANAGGAKDGHADDDSTGWDYFRQGRSVFYGAGSWDAATRNDSSPDYFSFGQMPTPVAEDYALYSKTSTPDYDQFTLVEYSNANNVKGTGENALANDKAMRTTPSDGMKAYSAAEIYANQILRQDKWAARMDSVGYAANGRLAALKGTDDPENWKADAAASLIAALTVREDEQVTLTYAGAQLPNFVQYCTDFLKYQKTEADRNYVQVGEFKDMLTPDGFADNTPYIKGNYTAENIGKAIWDYYYKVAVAMAKDSFNSNLTVKEWVEQNKYGDFDGSDKGDQTKTLRYDPAFADTSLRDFTGESGNNYYSAMRALRMVNFTYADRDLNIRMQTGLNAVRDCTMYTTIEDGWINGLDSRSLPQMLTYNSTMKLNDATILAALQQATSAAIGRTYNEARRDGDHPSQWYSPAYYATTCSITCDTTLQGFIVTENDNLKDK